MTNADKTAANHIAGRIRIYDQLIESAEADCKWSEVERLTAIQDELRSELRRLIF